MSNSKAHSHISAGTMVEGKKFDQAIIRDIIAHKRAEETLQASETRYRRLFEAAQDGILILNAETGQIDDVNPYMIDMLHYSHEEFVGKKLWEVSPFKDKVFNRAAFEELQDKGYIRYKDLPLQTKEGKSIAVEFVSNVYRANGNKVIQCNIRNITDRKQAEEALQISETRYRRLFESTRDGILILDVDTGQVIDANPFMQELLGYSCEEFVGKTLWDIGAFKDIAASKDSFDELQRKGYVRYEDLPVETSDGRRINVEFVSNAYTVDSKNVI
ncbi:MAG TPA: PAS domain S-box protein, partial [Syntrophales bacterium]